MIMSISKEELGNLVTHYFKELGINKRYLRKINHYLGQIEKEKEDKETTLHSERVCILSVEIAAANGKDPKMICPPALGHDIGKLTVDSYLLKKKNFTAKDNERMKPHVINGVEIMRKIDPFYAAVILFHHYHKPNDSYPSGEEAEEWLVELSLPESIKQMAKEYGILLAMGDVYDSMVTRDNNVYGGKVPPEETEPLMFEAFKDRNMNHKAILRMLYDQGIFGQNYKGFLRKLYVEHVEEKDKNILPIFARSITLPPVSDQKHR